MNGRYILGNPQSVTIQINLSQKIATAASFTSKSCLGETNILKIDNTNKKFNLYKTKLDLKCKNIIKSGGGG
jgi:hypothetical protein